MEEKKKRGTAASNVLRSYFAKLCKQLRDPQPVARALFAEGIIDNQLLQQASNPHESVSKRVQDVLSDLYLKVQARPEWMETVCDIFKEEAVPYAWDIRGTIYCTHTRVSFGEWGGGRGVFTVSPGMGGAPTLKVLHLFCPLSNS